MQQCNNATHEEQVSSVIKRPAAVRALRARLAKDIQHSMDIKA